MSHLQHAERERDVSCREPAHRLRLPAAQSNGRALELGTWLLGSRLAHPLSRPCAERWCPCGTNCAAAPVQVRPGLHLSGPGAGIQDPFAHARRVAARLQTILPGAVEPGGYRRRQTQHDDHVRGITGLQSESVSGGGGEGRCAIQFN